MAVGCPSASIMVFVAALTSPEKMPQMIMPDGSSSDLSV